MVAGAVGDKDIWVVDSGCNVHIVNDKKWLTTLDTSQEKSVGTADGRVSLSVKGTGSVVVECITSNGKMHKILLQQVLYAPEGRYNLLSMAQLLKDGKMTISTDQAGMTLN